MQKVSNDPLLRTVMHWGSIGRFSIVPGWGWSYKHWAHCCRAPPAPPSAPRARCSAPLHSPPCYTPVREGWELSGAGLLRHTPPGSWYKTTTLLQFLLQYCHQTGGGAQDLYVERRHKSSIWIILGKVLVYWNLVLQKHYTNTISKVYFFRQTRANPPPSQNQCPLYVSSSM